MVNQFIRQVGQSAGDAAKKMAKQVVREPFEMAKNIKDQVVQVETPAESPGSDQSQLGHEENFSKINEAEINAEAKMKLADLEGEVKRLIEERKRRAEEWKKEQDEKMAADQKSAQDNKTLVQPTSKRKSGFMGMMKGKQGTKEVGKGPSG